MKHFNNVILLIFSLLTFVGCQKELYNFEREYNRPEVSREPALIEFIVDYDNYDNVSESSQLQKTSDYTKIPFQEIKLEDFNRSFRLSSTTRVLCVYDPNNLKDAAIDTIQNFVARGGTLLITKTTKDERLNYLLGLSPTANYKTDSLAQGYTFKKPLFPDMKGFSYQSKDHRHGGLSEHNFSDYVDVLMTASNRTTYPVLLENKIGKGKVVYYNSSIGFNKWSRGIIFSCALLGLEGIPYPVANTSTIFLDDFPSPLYNIYKAPVKEELGLTIAEYVTDVWWPDMKTFASDEDIEYSAYVAFDYNTYIRPPFTFKEWDANLFSKNNTTVQQSSWLGRDVIESGHEMALHGYNHVSLLKSDWKEPEYMVTALSTAAKKWKTLNFGNLPTSYVPPSNYIDSIGLAKLQKGMPSIKYIQSTYLGDKEEGGDRDFDPDPYNDYFFGYPRITSGFDLQEIDLLTMESMYLYTGIWTHFVHPDDVFQIPDESNKETSGHFEFRNRNNLNWNSSKNKIGLFDRFKNEVVSFKKRHPYSRFLNATESSDLVKDWRYAYFTHLQQNGNYIVDSDYFPSGDVPLWLTYVNEENDEIIEDYLKEQQLEFQKRTLLNGHLYSIKTEDALLSLPNLMIKGENYFTSNAEALAYVREEAILYLEDQKILLPLSQNVEELVAEGKLKAATDLLELKISENAKLTRQQWEDYATYMVWQKRGKEVWPVLEKYYQKNKSKRVVSISRSISKVADYATKRTRENWLTRHISWRTNDLEILNEYVDYFSVPERKTRVLTVLKKIVALNPNKKNVKKYLDHLLEGEFDGLVLELNTIKPCDKKYRAQATTIAWAYADNLKFDKALQWQKCSSDIDKETVNGWLIYSTEFEKLKHTDYPLYLELLLAKDSKRALGELHSKEPCVDSTLEHLAAKIAYAYEEYKMYREALAWSECDKDVKITAKLSWLHQLKEYKKATQLYENHIIVNPEDYGTKVFMSILMLYQGDVKSSVEITKALPKGIDKTELREQINKELKNLSIKDQREILNQTTDLVYSHVRKDVSRNIRLEEGNSVSMNGQATYDKFDPASITNILSYNMYDKKYNVHSVSATQSTMYPINGVTNAENIEHNLFGLEYRFKNVSGKKHRFWASARLEKDNFNEFFYQFGTELNYTKEKQFTSYQLNFYPVRTGPGHSLNLYQAEFNNYNEFSLSKRFTQIFALQGNYYTDNELEAIVLGRTEYNMVNQKKFKLGPLLEAVYSRGTSDKTNGYPYWMAESRVFGGGGLNLVVGDEKSRFNLTADAAYFIESAEPNFQRYTGNLAYRIFNFTTLRAGFEIYTLENYYSNVYQLGLVYDFK